PGPGRSARQAGEGPASAGSRAAAWAAGSLRGRRRPRGRGAAARAEKGPAPSAPRRRPRRPPARRLSSGWSWRARLAVEVVTAEEADQLRAGAAASRLVHGLLAVRHPVDLADIRHDHGPQVLRVGGLEEVD